MEVAIIGLFPDDNTDRHTLGLSQSEQRLIQLYRQMNEQEQRQIQRLIEQLARSSHKGAS